MTAQNNTPKTAVLICNTGSPAAPTKEAVAKYLAEFLGDRRVVEMNPLIWQPILRGIIIPRRAQASADRYKTVWTQKGSPLVAVTSDTAQGLQKALGDEFIVSWAMCYGVQRIEEELARIAAQKPERIVVLPLYAQYATQTTERRRRCSMRCDACKRRFAICLALLRFLITSKKTPTLRRLPLACARIGKKWVISETRASS